MDGNRTYARTNNLSLKEGHMAGAESLVHVLDTCYRVGVRHVTIYAFSIENFNRSQEEVDTLFALLRERLKLLSDNEQSYAMYNKVKIKIIGNRSMIPKDILDDLVSIEHKTAHNATKVLNVCFPYTSRDDITHSMKSCIAKTMNSDITKADIDLNMLVSSMYYGPDTPPLDILVRTSGQTRLSDFMLWQCNYNCTIEFVDVLWPDFAFTAMVKVLVKWGYYKTLQLEFKNQPPPAVLAKKDHNILNELAPHPPHKTVSQR